MYQALYRRYRPKSFNELLGQDHITRILKNQIKKQNIGHAYLFSGTRGTGKTSAAKIFSRAVNCLSPIDGNPCNKCENCQEILDNNTVDVIEMDAASNNSVDDIRDLRDKVIYAPAKIKYKVYIVDEVHMLSKGAFNALLKTLEEPPKHLIFILATTEPERLPATILSRCQRFDFRRISNEDIVINMEKILKDLKIQIDRDALNLIARNADGAMRDALSLLDQCVSYNSEVIKYEDAINILGVTNRDLIFDLVDRMKAEKTEDVLVAIDEIIQSGKDVGQFIKDLIEHFRNLMVVKSSKSPELIIEVSNMDKYIEQSNLLDLDYILEALDILAEADSQAKWSSQPRIILEMATLKLINLNKSLSLEERIKRLEQGLGPTYKERDIPEGLEIKSGEDKMVEEEKKQPAFEDKEEKLVDKRIEPVKFKDDGGELDFDTINQEWPKVLQVINRKDVKTHAFLIEGEILSFRENLLTIGYKEGFGFHQQAINTPKRKELVEKIVSEYFNRNIRINFVISNNMPKREEKKETSKHKAVKEVLDFFGEDIVEIK